MQMSPRIIEAGLTRREWQILHLIVDGVVNSEISRRLDVSNGCVSSLKARIYSRTGCANDVLLAVKATKEGIPLEWPMTKPPKVIKNPLTIGDKKIIGLVGLGLGAKEIAKHLNRSALTIKNRKTAIIAKLGLRGRGALEQYVQEARA